VSLRDGKMDRINSEICLRAALNPSDVSINQIKKIAAYAYGRIWQDEKGKCACGRTLVKSIETHENICPTLIK
jgi:hypothetical protein